MKLRPRAVSPDPVVRAWAAFVLGSPEARAEVRRLLDDVLALAEKYPVGEAQK